MKWPAVAAVVWIAAGTGQAWAQTASSKRHGLEVDLGAVWTRGGSYGSSDANLTTPAGTAQPLFSVSTRLGVETAMEAHLAVRIVGHLRAELTSTWGHASVRSRVTADFEGAAPVTVSDRLTVFTIEGSGIWYFGRHGKLQPFVRAGAGWMRELTTGEVLAADGTVANAGVGVKYWWLERNRGLLKRLGLRSEARVAARFGGLELGTQDRLTSPSIAVSIIIGF